MLNRYVALLRGINVGGNNIVPMKELKAVFESHGCQEVSTYINSGNVFFSSSIGDRITLQTSIQALLKQHFGLDLALAVLTCAEIADALAHAPDWWGREPEVKHNAIFVIPPVSADRVLAEVGPHKPDYEKVGAYGQVIFWSAPLLTFSRTRWSKIVGTSAYDWVTIRNANTFRKIVELSKG